MNFLLGCSEVGLCGLWDEQHEKMDEAKWSVFASEQNMLGLVRTKQFFLRMEALTEQVFHFLLTFLLKKNLKQNEKTNKILRKQILFFVANLEVELLLLNCCCCCCCRCRCRCCCCCCGGGGGGAVFFKHVESSGLVSNFTFSSYGKLGGV